MRYWMVMIMTAFMSLTFSAPASADKEHDREHMDGHDRERGIKAGDTGAEQASRMENERRGNGAEKSSPWWWPF